MKMLAGWQEFSYCEYRGKRRGLIFLGRNRYAPGPSLFRESEQVRRLPGIDAGIARTMKL
jgi:hypothetical protein